MERNDRCFCGSGKKYKKCHYRINADSKLARIYSCINEFDKYCQENGIVNNCVVNCSKCCHDFFFISEMEFLVILEYLTYNNIDIEQYITKADSVKRDIQTKYPILMERINEYMPANENSTLDNRFFDDTINPRDLLPCIFLNKENKCSVYEVRPSVCRGYGSTETCEIIGNFSCESREEVNLHIEISAIVKDSTEKIILKKRTDKVIVKRPYPLFYWFSFFMKEPYRETMLKKMQVLRDKTNDEYYDFTNI